MKNRRGKKPTREEWDRPAHSVVDRLFTNAQPVERPAISKEVQDLAYHEWLKWAQAAVDRPFSIQDQPLAIEKPGRGEWIRWARVVVERLTTCAQIYSKPPYDDISMPPGERQNQNAKTIDLLRRFHTITDDADTPTDSLADLEHHDERVIAGLNLLLRETLERLPDLSSDMQKFLRSPWREDCNGRLAEELFRGPLGHEPEGIGNGYPAQGRLPEVLFSLLEREQTGRGRHPREALPGPYPHDPRWQDETHRRWVEHNAYMLRSAGRVE